MKYDHQAVASVVPEQMPQVARWDRRTCVKSLAALVGSAALLGYDIKPVAAEPPPETTKLRIIGTTAACTAPQYIVEELLHAEGFSEVQYVPFRNQPARTRRCGYPG